MSYALHNCTCRFLFLYACTHVGLLTFNYFYFFKVTEVCGIDLYTHVCRTVQFEHELIGNLLFSVFKDLECEKEASFKDESVACSLESECNSIKQLLRAIRLAFESSPMELPTLIALGKLRFALAACARILHANFIEPENAVPLAVPLKDLVMEVSVVCTMASETDWPK